MYLSAQRDILLNEDAHTHTPGNGVVRRSSAQLFSGGQEAAVTCLAPLRACATCKLCPSGGWVGIISSIHSVVHPQPLLPKRFHPPREISAPIQHSLPSFLSPSPGNHRFTFCLYGLPHSPFFLKTESETL